MIFIMRVGVTIYGNEMTITIVTNTGMLTLMILKIIIIGGGGMKVEVEVVVGMVLYSSSSRTFSM